VLMTGPDERMDHVGDKRRDANALPAKCPHCTFPDLGFVSAPYLLARGFASPAETAPARLGNFLVRERVKQVLELVVPDACAFFPTVEYKSRKATSWWLAVPKTLLKTAMPTAKAPFCSKCGEPKIWGPLMGPVWSKMAQYDSKGVDVFKSQEWFSRSTIEDDFKETNACRKRDNLEPLPWSDWRAEPPPHPERWTRRDLDRELYFSVRLEQLFKRVKIKGQLIRLLSFEDVSASAQDEAWIGEKLELLAQHNLTAGAKSVVEKSSTSWFKRYLQLNKNTNAKRVDFAPIEKKHRLKLPQAYKDFISTVGEKSFAGINETEGVTAVILPPAQLDFKDYRQGKLKELNEEQSQIDGVMFASTEHGDCFVFDVSKKASGDYPIYHYEHEQNSLELFAPNFAACIKRFVEKN